MRVWVSSERERAQLSWPKTQWCETHRENYWAHSERDAALPRHVGRHAARYGHHQRCPAAAVAGRRRDYERGIALWESRPHGPAQERGEPGRQKTGPGRRPCRLHGRAERQGRGAPDGARGKPRADVGRRAAAAALSALDAQLRPDRAECAGARAAHGGASARRGLAARALRSRRRRRGGGRHGDAVRRGVACGPRCSTALRPSPVGLLSPSGLQDARVRRPAADGRAELTGSVVGRFCRVEH